MIILKPSIVVLPSMENIENKTLTSKEKDLLLQLKKELEEGSAFSRNLSKNDNHSRTGIQNKDCKKVQYQVIQEMKQ